MVNRELVIVMLALSVVQVNPDGKNITRETGDNVPLLCQVVNSSVPIVAINLTRSGLGSEHVLFFRDGKVQRDNQHPSYEGRVELRNLQMDGGDVSLIITNLTVNDSGTYTCEVTRREGNNPVIKSTCNFTLDVRPPGPKSTSPAGPKPTSPAQPSTDVIVGIVIGVIVIVIVIGVIVKYRIVIVGIVIGVIVGIVRLFGLDSLSEKFKPHPSANAADDELEGPSRIVVPLMNEDRLSRTDMSPLKPSCKWTQNKDNNEVNEEM
ncbi:uncharacterized protein [Embiotoca jacksoni]|uniref:uncharacterized protein n=1 Tax=Embiotoca jacksoni TaxID=100190 RepID=UPI00370432AF